MKAPTAIVLDIEGTTTPISFVYDTLFPYARERVGEFLRAHADEPEVREDLVALAEQAERDALEGLSGAVAFNPENIEAAAANVRWQMDSDRKTTALKSLQGKIWRSGYADGALRGALFEDVPRAFDAWSRSDRVLAIYSSGSIEAQRLLFRHSVAGDLTPMISAHFDTTTGPKREAASYLAIVESLGLAASDVLFATDVVEEAQAAQKAGLQAVIMDRPGNHPTAPHDFPVLESFDELR